MTDKMSSLRKFVEKIPLLTNGEALVGLAFVVAGALVARQGIGRLSSLWVELSPHFPFSLPPDTAQWIQQSCPLIFNLFVSTVASMCAVLIGALWIFAGLWEAIESRKRSPEAPDFHSPELVAESLRTAAPKHWKKTPWLAWILSLVWPRARLMSPVSFEIFSTILGSFWKILLGAALIAVVTYSFHLIPLLVKAQFGGAITLVVPSPRPLYYLLLLVAAVDLAIALTLVPIRRRTYVRRNSELPTWGWGSPQIFFALIEEGCRLLTEKGNQERTALRMEEAHSPQIKGTLIESNPSYLSSLARPAAYLCLPLVLYFLVSGFSRLIYFSRPVAAVPYHYFFSHNFLDYVLQVAFALGLIICGYHFAERARRLFEIRVFRSSLIFAHISRSGSAGRAGAGMPGHGLMEGAAQNMAWKVIKGGDDQLALWARQPRTMGRFRMALFWSEVVTEAAGSEGLRYVAEMDISRDLDAAMDRIIELPFNVDLKQGEPAPARAPQSEKTTSDPADQDSSPPDD